MELKNKKVSIIGAVKSGIGAAKLVKKLGGIPFVTDAGAKEKISDYLKSLDQEGIAYETGGHTDKVYDCDFIVASPGVPSDAPVLVKAKQKGLKVISEIELASQFCKGKIIAITGTNGKTTTTSLCDHLLNESGLKTYAAGNIGFAFSEAVLDVKENEYVALETSSFQIDHIDKFKPFI
ncbi:MAG TPA: Mur ligase family protein [Ignavibacteriales bacterium]|nr:Mur ligase family protein [Ignavibacteriales bacterium]